MSIYYREMMKEAEKADLEVHTQHYVDAARMTRVLGIRFIHKGPARIVIAKAELPEEYPYECERAEMKALTAIKQYQSWV